MICEDDTIPKIETVSFGLLYPALLRVVPGTSQQWLDFYLGQALAEMAMRTRVLRRTITLDAQAGVSDYPVELPEGYTLAYIEKVCVAGREHTASRDVPCKAGANCSPCAHIMNYCDTSNATFNAVADGSEIRVMPAPTMDLVNGVSVEVSLVPSRTACEMPKTIYDRYASTIITTALSELMLDPTLKVSPRTLNIIERRMERNLRRAKQDGDSGALAGMGDIRPPTQEFFI